MAPGAEGPVSMLLEVLWRPRSCTPPSQPREAMAVKPTPAMEPLVGDAHEVATIELAHGAFMKPSNPTAEEDDPLVDEEVESPAVVNIEAIERVEIQAPAVAKVVEVETEALVPKELTVVAALDAVVKVRC